MGLACGIPAWFVSGVVWGSWIGKRVLVEVPDEFIPEEAEADTANPPSLGTDRVHHPGAAGADPRRHVRHVLLGGGSAAVGPHPARHPAIALTIAVLLALYLLGTRRGIAAAEMARISGLSLRPVGMILLVVGAGAFFGAVLRATGIGTGARRLHVRDRPARDRVGLPDQLRAADRPGFGDRRHRHHRRHHRAVDRRRDYSRPRSR